MKLKLKKKYKILLINIIILIFIVVFCYSSYKFIRKISYNKKMDNIEEKITKEVITDKKDKDDKNKEEDNFDVNFEKLRKINSDVVGWIYIPNTHINYPIVKGLDNEYYLDHSVYKDYNILGSIYMNSSNSRDFSDNNTIIFGHTSDDGNYMFTDLNKIYEGKLGERVNIYIHTEKENYVYQIYSAYITDDTDSSPLSIDTSFYKKTDRKFFYDKSDVSNTLTLSTCYKHDKRIIIHALKI